MPGNSIYSSLKTESECFGKVQRILFTDSVTLKHIDWSAFFTLEKTSSIN